MKDFAHIKKKNLQGGDKKKNKHEGHFLLRHQIKFSMSI